MSIIDDIKASMDLRESYDATNRKWRQECNAVGLEIFYDMSNPKTFSAYPDCGCDGPCLCLTEIGQYKTRPCTRHFEGHQCNPLGDAKIVGFGP